MWGRNAYIGRVGRNIFIVLAVTVGFALADLLWLPFSTVSLDPRNFIELAKTAIVLAGSYGIGRFVVFRLRGVDSQAARIMRRLAVSLKAIAVAGALFIPLGFTSAVFMYLASATTRPLMDATFADLDAAMGFDWMAFLALTDGVPAVAMTLIFAYHSLTPQVVLLFAGHSLARKADQLFELVALLAVSSAFTGPLMALMPAAGAYAYFRPAPDKYASFTSDAGMWHYAELLRLRSGEEFHLIVAQSQGLVTFPSYHTVLAILVVYSLREFRWLAIPLALLNATMIVATLPEGGHHLIDVIVGVLIATATIAIVRGFQSLRTASPATASSEDAPSPARMR
ncbi:phosphatase PAP2 family protein [Mesorhizobium sp. B2-3-11]|uniref:phosphatase PAP2 family protein n=1 Tax=Mesorhizobium sp. B2-3-11 TaxID=2589953 RepID=UPI00112674BB|nr:phosphatase PAP2 family protein [Mesorhizobium sp. B2-3-11]TPM03770.1 phosphatase PAP2 family protein [Mesorhizobium sp. B2-3-11]